MVSQKKVGRNDPCPCGSGKKILKSFYDEKMIREIKTIITRNLSRRPVENVGVLYTMNLTKDNSRWY